MFDNESLLLAEIMSTTILKDFYFLNLRYFGRNDLLVHIKRFNDMMDV